MQLQSVMRLSVGDRIEDTTTGKVVEILLVRESGYTWRTVSTTNNAMVYAYRSDESDDPFFDQGWRLQPRSHDLA